jgi:quercetin dioxygenase-like cupin family protein
MLVSAAARIRRCYALAMLRDRRGGSVGGVAMGAKGGQDRRVSFPAPRRLAMPFQLRRVVSGHDDNGRAVVLIDETATKQVSARPGATASVVWTTEGFPVDNNGHEDDGRRQTGTTLANGTVFRVLELAPGSAPRNHRTDSIDYAVIMKGEIDMELDDTTVHLKAGDVLVQRGTIHNWVNRGTEPCLIAFVLIAAEPVTAGGRVLHAQG